jgi:heme/copper-type cytochrome/quinol oxidase subunit 2
VSTNRQRNLWRTGFLIVTLGALVMECAAAWDGNPNTDPWTDLITTYIPWQVAVAVFGALVLWVPVHFITAYRRRAKRKRAAEQEI